MSRLAFQLSVLAILFACSPAAQPPSQTTFYILRLDPPALVQFSEDLKTIVHEIPLSVPSECSFGSLFPSPRGATLAIELSCSFGQTVLFLDTGKQELTQAFTKSDSHFLAWTPDGQAVYLKVEPLGNTHILRANVNGRQDFVPITELTYDLAPASNGRDFLFSYSRGMGFGSEMYFAQFDGNIVKRVLADAGNYLSFARWSPDERQIAFIKIPDSQTPFPMGGLWLMDADGSNARKLTDADAGHGFAPAWSPDGREIAYVARENSSDPRVEQDSTVLVSNIYLANAAGGTAKPLTRFENARVETPVWSPDGSRIAFTVVLNDKMSAYLADAASGETRPLITEPACCAAWMRK